MKPPSLLTLGVALATVLVALPFESGVSVAVPVEKFIQPGRGLQTAQSCILGFVLEDGDGTKYVTTAGHCTGPGQYYSHPIYGTWGDLVYRDERTSPLEMDIALVKVRPTHPQHVEPSVRYFGGPTASAASASLPPLQEIGHVGAPGLGQAATTLVFPPRAGFLTEHTGTTWTCLCVTAEGDSGSPFIVLETGEALGLLFGSALGTPGASPSSTGVNFDVSLAHLQQNYRSDLQLVTAPLATPWPGFET